MKICLVGAELFRTDGRTYGQTDMTKLIVAFGKYMKTSKSLKQILKSCENSLQ